MRLDDQISVINIGYDNLYQETDKKCLMPYKKILESAHVVI